jgi:hypothetical protein
MKYNQLLWRLPLTISALFPLLVTTQSHAQDPPAPTTKLNTRFGISALPGDAKGANIAAIIGVQRNRVGRDIYAFHVNTDANTLPLNKNNVHDSFLNPLLSARGGQFLWSNLRLRDTKTKPKQRAPAEGMFIRVGFTLANFSEGNNKANGTIYAPSIGYQGILLLDQSDDSVSTDRKNTFAMGYTIAYTERSLGGAILNKSNDALRTSVLGDNKKRIPGIEASFYATQSNLQPYVQMSWFKGTTNINGLTGANLTLGVRYMINIDGGTNSGDTGTGPGGRSPFVREATEINDYPLLQSLVMDTSDQSLLNQTRARMMNQARKKSLEKAKGNLEGVKEKSEEVTKNLNEVERNLTEINQNSNLEIPIRTSVIDPKSGKIVPLIIEASAEVSQGVALTESQMRSLRGVKTIEDFTKKSVVRDLLDGKSVLFTDGKGLYTLRHENQETIRRGKRESSLHQAQILF